MSREPESRYATATEFAADIRAFLGGFPVQARPATRVYVAQKFVQRHWVGILTAGVTALILIGATVVTTLQMLEARRQRDFAGAALARAEALNEWFGARPPPRGLPAFTHRPGSIRPRAGRCALASTLAEQQPARSEALFAEGMRGLPDSPEFAMDRADCLQRGAEVAGVVGDSALAIQRDQAAVQAMTKVSFEHEVEQLRIEEDLGEAYRQAGRYREALAVFERIWPRLVALGCDDTITAITWLDNWGLTLGQLAAPRGRKVAEAFDRAASRQCLRRRRLRPWQ